MTCKDCIHKVVCNALCPKGLPYMDDEFPAEAFCIEFKNNTGGWIKVTDKLPEDVYGRDREQITVLVYTKSKKVSQCSRCAEYKWDRREPLEKDVWKRTGEFYWTKNKQVTHWMPLPEPPRTKERGESE